MDIFVSDPRDARVAALLSEHLEDMASHSPPESMHALDVESLCSADVTFWAVWQDIELLGCGALSELDQHHGEIKSMRTARDHLRKGVANRILYHILDNAKNRKYSRLSLETGSMAAFAPARRLYESAGFIYCDPFADYESDPNSVFMTLSL